MQQPRSQQLNLILFVVLSSLIIVGWTILRPLIWPPPPKAVTPPPKVDPTATALSDILGHPAVAADPGAGGAALLALDAAYLGDAYKPAPPDKRTLALAKRLDPITGVLTHVLPCSD